jgi:hypothetical protein
MLWRAGSNRCREKDLKMRIAALRWKLPEMAAVLALLTCLVVQFGYKFVEVYGSPDSGWILKTGAYILETGRLPVHDLYSWTCADRPWIVYQWLFEVVAAAFLKVGLLWLAGLSAYTIAGILLFFILPRSWLSLSIPAWLTLAVLVLTVNDVWFFLRPQLASFLLLALWLAVLEQHRQGLSEKKIWFLPLLMVLWVNLHSFWFFGLAAVLSYAVPVRRRTLWLVFLFCLAAVFINPYGAKIITYNFSFVTDASRTIAELKSPFILNQFQHFLFLAYLSLCWLVLFWKSRELPKSGLAFAAFTTAAALYAARFMPLAILGTWTCLGLALSKTRVCQGDRPACLNSRLFVACQLVFSILVPFLLWCRACPTQSAAARLFAQGQFDGISFLSRHNVHGERLYNDESLGSRLLFFEIARVFIDNRFDMYGKEFCDRWSVAHYADPGWKAYLQSFGVTAVAISEGQPLYGALLNEPDWLPVYDDRSLSYWLSDTPGHRRQLVEWKLTPELVDGSALNGPALSLTRRIYALKSASLAAAGRSDLKTNRLEAACRSFELLVFLHPHDPEAHHLLIHTLAVSGKAAELKEALKKARWFFWHFDGEDAAPFSSFAPDQQKRIEDWCARSARELLKKYSPGNKNQLEH